MRVIETKVYGIAEHPNKDLCYEWIRDNWHGMNQHSVDEAIESLKELKLLIDGELDYSIGQSPSRGEFISWKNYDKEVLNSLEADFCPLTGGCWDFDLIKSMQEKGNASGLMSAIHQDTEYVYSDEGLFEYLDANDYEFTEEGKCI
tara:strand:- start:491 stop:928 length:438 start_codon:yes stop_codon:yes gene_type:complete